MGGLVAAPATRCWRRCRTTTPVGAAARWRRSTSPRRRRTTCCPRRRARCCARSSSSGVTATPSACSSARSSSRRSSRRSGSASARSLVASLGGLPRALDALDVSPSPRSAPAARGGARRRLALEGVGTRRTPTPTGLPWAAATRVHAGNFFRRLGEGLHQLRSPSVWLRALGWSMLSDVANAVTVGLCLMAVGVTLPVAAWFLTMLAARARRAGAVDAGAVRRAGGGRGRSRSASSASTTTARSPWRCCITWRTSCPVTLVGLLELRRQWVPTNGGARDAPEERAARRTATGRRRTIFARYVAFADRHNGKLLGALLLLMFVVARLRLAARAAHRHGGAVARQASGGAGAASHRGAAEERDQPGDADPLAVGGGEPPLRRRRWRPSCRRWCRRRSPRSSGSADTEVPEFARKQKWLYAEDKELDERRGAARPHHRQARRSPASSTSRAIPTRSSRSCAARWSTRLPVAEGRAVGLLRSAPSTASTTSASCCGSGSTGWRPRARARPSERVEAAVKADRSRREFDPQLRVDYTGGIAQAIDQQNGIRDDLTMATLVVHRRACCWPSTATSGAWRSCG